MNLGKLPSPLSRHFPSVKLKIILYDTAAETKQSPTQEGLWGKPVVMGGTEVTQLGCSVGKQEPEPNIPPPHQVLFLHHHPALGVPGILLGTVIPMTSPNSADTWPQ